MPQTARGSSRGCECFQLIISCSPAVKHFCCDTQRFREEVESTGMPHAAPIDDRAWHAEASTFFHVVMSPAVFLCLPAVDVPSNGVMMSPYAVAHESQLLTLTYPMVGNYGVPDRALRDEFGLARGFESDRIHASALLVQVKTTVPVSEDA